MTAAPRFRAHARRKVRLRCVLWHPPTATEKAGWQREVEVVDLGLGGASLRLMETLTAGDSVTLLLVAPTLWDPLAIPARIAWIGPPTRIEPGRAGVAFEPRDAASVFALFEMMGALGYEQ